MLISHPNLILKNIAIIMKNKLILLVATLKDNRDGV